MSYPFVKLINEPRQGIVFARNRGFNTAQGDLIGRIDADSRLSPNWVEQALKYFGEHQVLTAVGGDFYFYDFPFKRVGRFFFRLLYYKVQSRLAGSNIMLGANMVVRRSAWQKAAPLCHDDADIAEDVDLSINLARAGCRVDRPIKLMIEASMLRHNYHPLHIIQYLWRWPKTYVRNRKPLATALSGMVMLIIVLAAFVLFPVFVVAGSHKPHRPTKWD